MITRLVIFFFFGCIFVSTVRCQAANDTDTIFEQIKDIFEKANSTSTAASDIQQNRSCICVPYYLCNNGSINTDGAGTIDIAVNDSPCESYIEVCCNKEDQVKPPVSDAPPAERKSRCGFRNPDGIGFRITGDNENEAQYGEFPWMVAVLRQETLKGDSKTLNVYQCGGALVHPQMVVTAAHCVSGENNSFIIRAGEWDTQHTQELYPHQDRKVQNIVVHPQYTVEKLLYNDIAVLYLRSPLETAENVDTICLPPQGTVVDSSTCYATGWGKNIFGQSGKYQVILKKIDLSVVPNGECQSKLRTTRLGKLFELHNSFICAAGAPGKDTCKGDSGSPLVCPISGNDNRYYQAGIGSWGVGCGENNVPGVYVNLPLFREWIDTQMKSFGLDTSSYQY